MSSSKSLYNILHSLTQTERRYLKVYAQRHVKQEETRYSLLIDIVLGQTDPNVEELREKWVEAGQEPKNLASVKNYLKGLVLQAMRDFHRSNQPIRQIEDMLTDVKFLSNKGLPREAMHACTKAKDLANTLEMHSLVIQADSLLRAILTWTNSHDLEKELKDLEKSSYKAMRRFNRVTELHIKYYETFAWVRTKASIRENAEEFLAQIESNSLLDMQTTYEDFLSQFHRFRTLDNLAQLRGNTSAAYSIQCQILTLWENFPHLRYPYAEFYLNTLTNFLGICRATDQYTSMPMVFAQLEEFEPSSLYMELEIQSNLLFYRHLYHINIGEWERAGVIATNLEQFLKTQIDFVPRARVLAIRFNLAITFFFLQDSKRALLALNAILNDAHSQHREDIQQAARLMQAVVHYELGNTDLLEHLLRNAQHYMKKKGTLYTFEATLIRHLRQLITHPDNESDILQNLQNELSALKNDPANANAPGLEEIQYWIKSKLLGVPLHTLVGNPDKPNP